uniref:hypothetical protein n=3 Tax=Enterocloster clostridioformis TaxID=1531 RepID=UPI0025A4EF30
SLASFYLLKWSISIIPFQDNNVNLLESSYTSAGRAEGNQEGDEPVGPHFSGTGEIPAGTGRILGDAGYDMADGVSKSSFDVFM